MTRTLALMVLAAGVAVAQPLPMMGDGGPRSHVVRSASSRDGVTFADDGFNLLTHASVPCAIALSNGTIRIYYVDARSLPESANVAESRDQGRTFQPLGLEVEGRTRRKVLDPSIVALPNGQFRLYYYACDDRPDSPGVHEIDSALSEDGVHFRREGTVFARAGLVDPDVFWTGRDWLMLVFSAEEHTTMAAVSTNGTAFRYLAPITPGGWGTTTPFRTGKGFRMFAFDQARQQLVRSFLSQNGVSWNVEAGISLKVADGFEITDPFVVPLRDGTWKMFYKRGLAARGQGARPQPHVNALPGAR